MDAASKPFRKAAAPKTGAASARKAAPPKLVKARADLPFKAPPPPKSAVPTKAATGTIVVPMGEPLGSLTKAPAMLGASAKAYPSANVGATARRFYGRPFSKAATAATRAGSPAVFAGKAPAPPPPWRSKQEVQPKAPPPKAPWRRAQAPLAPPSARPKSMSKPQEPEEAEYDPFAEEPAPHVNMEKVFRRAARSAAAAEGKPESVEWRPKKRVTARKASAPGGAPRKAGAKAGAPGSVVPKKAAAPGGVPPKKEQPEEVPAKAAAEGPVVPKSATGWLKRPGNSRMSRGAVLAEAHFQKSEADEPQKKKPKIASLASRSFVQELLSKAPSTLQTCRSLLLFLDKKLEVKAPEKPQVGGPQALRSRLEAQADGTGRLAGLRAPGGWDSRAKRVLDIASAAASAPGVAALKALEEHLASESKALEGLLKESELTVDDAIKARQEWAKDTLRRDWLAWCAKLLRVREEKLLAEVEGKKEGVAANGEILMTAMDILEAILAGTTA